MTRWAQGAVFWFRRTTPDGSYFGCTSHQDWSFAAALKEELEERIGFGDVLEVRVFRNLEEMMEHDTVLIDIKRFADKPKETCPCCGSQIPKEIGVAYYYDGEDISPHRSEFHYRKVIHRRRGDAS